MEEGEKEDMAMEEVEKMVLYNYSQEGSNLFSISDDKNRYRRNHSLQDFNPRRGRSKSNITE